MRKYNPKPVSFKTTYTFYVKDRKLALEILDTVEGTMYDNADIHLTKKTGPLKHRIEYKFNDSIQDWKNYDKVPKMVAYHRNKLMNRLKSWKKEIAHITEHVVISHNQNRFNLK